jgi:hypothetical protein
MPDPEKAVQTQLANIQKKTGKTLTELSAFLAASGLSKHGELRDYCKTNLGLGHGDANMLVTVLRHAAEAPTAADPLDAIYTGPKAALRPIHEAFLTAIAALGPFEIAPEKANVSFRRKKQFALIGPATNTRVEVGLNMPALEAGPRLEALPPGGMCPYRVKLTSPAEVDEELLSWVRRAYAAAG